MSHWLNELSAAHLHEIVRSQKENRAWYSDIRRSLNELMDRKLAKRISAEVYAASRELIYQDVVECKRRSRMLLEEFTIRKHRLVFTPLVDETYHNEASII